MEPTAMYIHMEPEAVTSGENNNPHFQIATSDIKNNYTASSINGYR